MLSSTNFVHTTPKLTLRPVRPLKQHSDFGRLSLFDTPSLRSARQSHEESLHEAASPAPPLHICHDVTGRFTTPQTLCDAATVQPFGNNLDPALSDDEKLAGNSCEERADSKSLPTYACHPPPHECSQVCVCVSVCLCMYVCLWMCVFVYAQAHTHTY